MSVEATATGVASARFREALKGQQGALAALQSDLAREAGHAYLFAGPRGCGKAEAARAFAAELLALGSTDPEGTRERALADPSPHPDLAWLRPAGAQHLVDDVRERLIAPAGLRPLEGARRVFVIEDADAMADESQNALLKTLEEPPDSVCIVLLSVEPERLLATVRSRCRPVRFAALSTGRIEERLAEIAPGRSTLERSAIARLALGNLERAMLLAGAQGDRLRAAAELAAAAAREGDLAGRPWSVLLELAKEEGDGAEQREQERQRSDSEQGLRRSGQEADQALRRARRSAEAAMLDLGLALIAAWWRDLCAIAFDAPGDVLAVDRVEELSAQAAGLDGRLARRAAELAMQTRRRLEVNVGAELALEALFYRATHLVGRA